MNNLKNLMESLEQGSNEVFVDPEIGKQAMVSLGRMLEFREQQLAAEVV